jgi:hypothetical protein
LGEGGISVYGLVPKRGDQLFPVTFDLPGEGGSIKASAEIAWTSPIKYRTGVRFLNVAGASRQRLADWMATPCYAPGRIAVVRRPIEPIPFRHAMDSGATSVLEGRKNGLGARLWSLPIAQKSIPESESPKLLEKPVGRSRRAGKPRLVIGLVSVVALLFLAFAFSRYQLFNGAQTGQAREMTGTTVPESASKGSTASVNTLPETAPPLPNTTSLVVPGFVLQVGAMRNENNADGLSDSLQRKHLPAFVFKRRTDRFYRVAVGPYADMSSAMRVKDELQRENVEVILKRWVPDQR